MRLQHCPAPQSWDVVDWPSSTDCGPLRWARRAAACSAEGPATNAADSSLTRWGGLALRGPHGILVELEGPWRGGPGLLVPAARRSCRAGLHWICIVASSLARTQALCTGAANKLFLPGLAPQGSAPFCLAAPGPRASRGTQCWLAGLSRLALGTWGWWGAAGALWCPGRVLPFPSSTSPSAVPGWAVLLLPSPPHLTMGAGRGGVLSLLGCLRRGVWRSPRAPCPEAGSGPPGTSILGCPWVSAPGPQLSLCPLFHLPPASAHTPTPTRDLVCSSAGWWPCPQQMGPKPWLVEAPLSPPFPSWSGLQGSRLAPTPLCRCKELPAGPGCPGDAALGVLGGTRCASGSSPQPSVPQALPCQSPAALGEGRPWCRGTVPSPSPAHGAAWPPWGAATGVPPEL